jgi:hypothetical protein
MDVLPDPPIPSDVNCVGLPYMPLKVGELLESDLAELSSGIEFKAAVLLWCKSWTQVPAGSLPHDDRRLAKWSGVSIEEFELIRPMALRGWIACNDGKIYHPIICDLALAAWKTRKKNSENAIARWAGETRKNAVASDSRASASENGSDRKPKPMQGKVREEKVREESPLPPKPARETLDSIIIREAQVGEKLIPLTLRECLEAEEAGDNRNPAYALPEKIRSAEVWGMAKGILRVHGLDEKAAGILVGEMSKKHGMDADEVARAAVIIWRSAPRSAKPYFVSVCERIAAERRN